MHTFSWPAVDTAAKRVLALSFGLLVATFSTVAVGQSRESVDLTDSQPIPSLAPMLEVVTPAVVNIAVTRTQRMPEQFRFFGPQLRGPDGQPPTRRSRGAGSGVVVDSESGYIVTNH